MVIEEVTSGVQPFAPCSSSQDDIGRANALANYEMTSEHQLTAGQDDEGYFQGVPEKDKTKVREAWQEWQEAELLLKQARATLEATPPDKVYAEMESLVQQARQAREIQRHRA